MPKRRIILNNWMVRAETILKRCRIPKSGGPNPKLPEEIAAGLQRAYSDGRRSILRDQEGREQSNATADG